MGYIGPGVRIVSLAVCAVCTLLLCRKPKPRTMEVSSQSAARQRVVKAPIKEELDFAGTTRFEKEQ
jgi:hypothetical protein